MLAFSVEAVSTLDRRGVTLAREIVSDSGRPAPRIIEGIEELLLVRQVVHKYAKIFKSDYRTIKDSQRFLRDLLAFFHLMLQNDVRQDAQAMDRREHTDFRVGRAPPA